jgi:hypothetical protein
MLPETLQLERLRQQIEDAEYESGSQSDFLDRGKPNAKQAQQARDLMNRMDAQSRELKAQLHELLTRLRTEKPEAVTEWVDFHKALLKKIIAENISDANSRTRNFVAQQTLQAWEKVQAGEQFHVNINWHFLKDYKAEVKKLGTNKSTTHKSEQPAQKPWWKIW